MARENELPGESLDQHPLISVESDGSLLWNGSPVDDVRRFNSKTGLLDAIDEGAELVEPVLFEPKEKEEETPNLVSGIVYTSEEKSPYDK